MKNGKGLAVHVAGAMALAMLLVTSAFADSRHQSWTRHGSSGHHGSSGGSHHGSSGSSGGHHFFSHASPGHSSFFHSSPRNIGPRGGAWRGGGGPAFRGSRGGAFHRDFNDGHRFFGQGRIDRFERFHGGYRVWLGGWGYPFFVPYSFWDPFRFRVGLFVGLNAFYDPYGYYSVYGPGYYDGYYGGNYGSYHADVYGYDGSSLGGTVQSVDLNSGVVTIEDNRTRRIVSALLPPRDNRVDDIRPGDYIVLSGEWVRGSRYDFDADRLDRFDPRR